jgi:hypothetical protein
VTTVQEWAEKVRIEYGKLTPVTMVAAAREHGPGQCPVYERFKFDDDAAAAELWRLDEARNIIGRIRVTFKKSARGTDRHVRAYHAVPDSEGPEPYRFERAEDIAADPVLREIVLRDMEREWKTLKSRYGHMAEFVKMISDDLGGEAAA